VSSSSEGKPKKRRPRGLATSCTRSSPRRSEILDRIADERNLFADPAHALAEDGDLVDDVVGPETDQGEAHEQDDDEQVAHDRPEPPRREVRVETHAALMPVALRVPPTALEPLCAGPLGRDT